MHKQNPKHPAYGKSRKSYEEKSASYGYQPDQFAYHSLKEALDAKPCEHHAQTDAQMDERADCEVDHHAGEGADDYADVQMELQSRKDRLPLRTAGHHSRAHTEKLQLTLFDRLESNRYRYDDASYNTTPLFNSVGISANLHLAPFEVFVQLSDDYRSGYATSAMNGHKLKSMASVSWSFCNGNGGCVKTQLMRAESPIIT